MTQPFLPGLGPGFFDRMRGIFGGVFGSRGASMAAGTAAGFAASTAVHPLFRAAGDEMNRRFTNEKLTPADAALARRLKLLGDVDYDAEVERHGYDEPRRGVLYRLTRRFPDVATVLEALNRGVILEPEAVDRLERIGFQDADVETILALRFALPPLSDLVRFAVREVFSPEIRARFGQDEDYPADFTAEAEKRGLDEEQARNYWAAHWELPSVTQAFEMFHRRVRNTDGSLSEASVISEADLAALLRAQDVMPFWRDPLVAIAYNPITRVDIRRFHREGIFDAAELVRRYLDLGYGPEDATNLARFTVALNTEDEKGLTRALITGMYDLGILDRPAAAAQLKALRFPATHVELILEQVDLVKELAIEDEQVRVIRSRFVDFSINEDETVAALGQAGVTAQRQDQLLQQWRLQRDVNRPDLSLAKVQKLYRTGIIGGDEARDELIRQGWGPPRLEWLLAEAAPAAAEAPGEG